MDRKQENKGLAAAMYAAVEAEHIQTTLMEGKQKNRGSTAGKFGAESGHRYFATETAEAHL